MSAIFLGSEGFWEGGFEGQVQGGDWGNYWCRGWGGEVLDGGIKKSMRKDDDENIMFKQISFTAAVNV